MEKFKYFITDAGSMAALIICTIVFAAFTYYTFFCIGWLISAIIYVIVIAALIWDRNKTYNNTQKLKKEGYNV